MYDVLCTGITCCDLIFAELDKLPEAGKESLCADFVIKPGGAANTPAALAKLGMNTLFTSIIGNDDLGRIVLKYLNNTGLDMSAFITDMNCRTTISAVLSVRKERAFASYFAKSDDKKIIENLNLFVPQSRHVHTYIQDCLRMPIVDITKKNGKTISIDMGWDENLRLKDITHILQNCDVFFSNDVEACSITGESHVEKAIDKIGEYAEVAVVKLGAKGSLVRKGKTIIKIPPAVVIEVKDTTGAGDLYAAGFIYGLLKGWNLERTAMFASASGALAVTFYGGMDELYTMENVLRNFNNNSNKYTTKKG